MHANEFLVCYHFARGRNHRRELFRVVPTRAQHIFFPSPSPPQSRRRDNLMIRWHVDAVQSSRSSKYTKAKEKKRIYRKIVQCRRPTRRVFDEFKCIAFAATNFIALSRAITSSSALSHTNLRKQTVSSTIVFFRARAGSPSRVEFIERCGVSRLVPGNVYLRANALLMYKCK